MEVMNSSMTIIFITGIFACSSPSGIEGSSVGITRELGAMVETLIKDIANWDRNDSRFPFLRNFDPYEGHSWASGHAGFADGNNQNPHRRQSMRGRLLSCGEKQAETRR